jgi:hypothetical protein
MNTIQQLDAALEQRPASFGTHTNNAIVAPGQQDERSNASLRRGCGERLNRCQHSTESSSTA